MSWQLAAFSLLALGLVAGFGWYERSRPDARIVALVATLAAFAALGRIAFAALPNVKPTTDIVLVSGYALGGAPGFAVGALAGLTSNFFFGQGPWTPWQMAAWGVTGIIGALLARATRGRIGRVQLALVCGIVGYAFAAVQDVGDWVTYSDHSLAQLGVYVGKGTGFDLIHAVGCVAFALAFGPALIHSLQRFARRLHVVWGDGGIASGSASAPTSGSISAPTSGSISAPTSGSASGSTSAPSLDVPLAALLAAVLAAGWLASQTVMAGLGGMAGASAQAQAAGTPSGYLLSAQHRDGGFGSSPAAPSSQLYAGWAALGMAAAGYNPQDVRHGGASLLDYIRAGANSSLDSGSLERTILAARAAGVSVRGFGGSDLLVRLEGRIRRDGSVAEQVNLTSFAVLALRAAGVAPPARTLSWLLRQQDRDGGFNFATAGGGSDVDDTGAALQALKGDARAGSARSRAVAFVRRQQNRDGGFPSDPGGESNAQSTAWAVQGLIAAGIDPNSLHRLGAASPLQFLHTLIGPDGHVHYSRTADQTPVWVTAQALLALDRKPLPLAPVPRSHRAAGAAAGATVARSARRRRPLANRKKVHRSRGIVSAPARGSLLGYAADVGVAAALALAPVGLG